MCTWLCGCTSILPETLYKSLTCWRSSAATVSCCWHTQDRKGVLSSTQPWPLKAPFCDNLAHKSGVVGGEGLKSHRMQNDKDQSCWLCSVFQSALQPAKLVKPAPDQQIAPGAAQQQQQQQQLDRNDTLLSAGPAQSQLEQMMKQQQIQQQPGDCLGCRVTGLMLGLGGGGYVSSRLFEDPKPKGAHRFTLIGVSLGLFALGIGRAFGF